MALAILDGTQTATTLSTILSSGQHITAHTVVSLGTQAKTDILSAVSSGIAISGTVTANLAGNFNGAIEIVNDDNNTSHAVAMHMYDNAGLLFGKANNPFAVSGTVTAGGRWYDGSNYQPTPFLVTEDGALQTVSVLIQPIPAGTNRIGVVTIGAGTVTIGAGTAQIGSVTASISGTVPISISSVTVGNSVTIGSLPAISGTVTANIAISSTAITSGSFSSLTSATLVPGNTARKMATVYNLGAGQLFVNQGASATTLGGGFMVALSSGDFYECDYTTTTLSAIFATAGTASWVSH
jgi:hypothetical protein